MRPILSRRPEQCLSFRSGGPAHLAICVEVDEQLRGKLAKRFSGVVVAQSF
jgi:hypothetical protein